MNTYNHVVISRGDKVDCPQNCAGDNVLFHLKPSCPCKATPLLCKRRGFATENSQHPAHSRLRTSPTAQSEASERPQQPRSLIASDRLPLPPTALLLTCADTRTVSGQHANTHTCKMHPRYKHLCTITQKLTHGHTETQAQKHRHTVSTSNPSPAKASRAPVKQGNDNSPACPLPAGSVAQNSDVCLSMRRARHASRIHLCVAGGTVYIDAGRGFTCAHLHAHRRMRHTSTPLARNEFGASFSPQKMTKSSWSIETTVIQE